MTDTTSTAVTAAHKHPLVVLGERLEARASEIKAAWPEMSSDRIIRAVKTAAQINPELLACSFGSMWLSIMRACRDGLLPDGREGAIVPYKDKAVWIPMYQGLVRQFQRSGDFQWIAANVVYEGEPFEHWIDDSGEHIRHTPDEIFDDRLIRKAYAMATTKSGGRFIAVMSRAEIDKIRKLSRTTREDAPWNQHFSEMTKKTVLRRLCKVLPIDSPIDDEIDDDEIAETPKPQVTTIVRERGAAAALDLLAGSPEESPAAGETGGGGADAGSSAARIEPASKAAAADVAETAQKEDPLSAQAIEIAHRRGREAKEKNQPRKSLPPEYRVPERDAEAQAWLAGHSGEPIPERKT